VAVFAKLYSNLIMMSNKEKSNQNRLMDFFKETPVAPFESIPTVLMVGVAHLDVGTNINFKAIFEHVQIYEIPNYQRGKNKKVKIPHPGVPYVVLSAKLDRNIRGIPKKLSDLEPAKGNKGKFPNQVTLDISLKDKNVNVMISKDSLKVTGALKIDHLTETFIFVKALLLSMQADFDHYAKEANENNRKLQEEAAARGEPIPYFEPVTPIKLFDKSPLLASLEIEMLNVVFDLGFRIRKEEMSRKAAECSLFSPPEVTKDAVRILYPMKDGKAKGGNRYFNFRVFHTGKVIYSAKSRKDMEGPYNDFIRFIKENESDIRFV
jgi:hypothetical protein